MCGRTLFGGFLGKEHAAHSDSVSIRECTTRTCFRQLPCYGSHSSTSGELAIPLSSFLANVQAAKNPDAATMEQCSRDSGRTPDK